MTRHQQVEVEQRSSGKACCKVHKRVAGSIAAYCTSGLPSSTMLVQLRLLTLSPAHCGRTKAREVESSQSMRTLGKRRVPGFVSRCVVTWRCIKWKADGAPQSKKCTR